MRAEALKKWIRFRSRPFSGCKSDFGPEKKGKKIIQPSTAWYQIRTDSLRLALRRGVQDRRSAD